MKILPIQLYHFSYDNICQFDLHRYFQMRHPDSAAYLLEYESFSEKVNTTPMMKHHQKKGIKISFSFERQDFILTIFTQLVERESMVCFWPGQRYLSGSLLILPDGEWNIDAWLSIWKQINDMYMGITQLQEAVNAMHRKALTLDQDNTSEK